MYFIYTYNLLTEISVHALAIITIEFFQVAIGPNAL